VTFIGDVDLASLEQARGALSRVVDTLANWMLS